MINIIKAVLEAAETNDFSLTSIDPKEKSYNEETDNMLYREAYEKACIGVKTCYDAHEKLFREVIYNLRDECGRTNINQDAEKNVELHVISVNPQIDFNVMKLLEDFFTSWLDTNKFNSSEEFLTALQCNAISQRGSEPISKEGYIGPVVSLPMKGILVAENLNKVERNTMNAADELYSIYEFMSKKIAKEKNPMYLEAYARMFEYCAKLISYEIGAYGVAALELLQIGRNLMPMNESAVLTEGFVGGVFTGILISPIVLTAGLVSWWKIYNKILDNKLKKEAEKEKNKLVFVKDSRNITSKNCDKLLNEAKFAKYDPNAISYMKDIINLLNKYNSKLESIDNKFFKLSSIDEYTNKKSYFEKEYKDIYAAIKKESSELNKKYKKSPIKEWVCDLNIIKPLKEYIHIINELYYRNTAGDDWWESVDLFVNAWKTNTWGDELDDIYEDMYNTFTTFPDNELADMIDTESPFSMIKIQFTGDTLNESAVLLESTNEENAKKYIGELDKLIDEIRAFYDKFEYKEIIVPRKKKEHKMFEYVLGALERKYTLKIPIYKVEGVSEDVKDIVEHKFIDKIESIVKKYPNFVVLSPNWENESDMFIYITLREPFGDKEDRKDREQQAQNESASNDPMATAIDRKIESLKRKIEMNEKVQDRYIEKNGYENKSIAEEHDRMCDQMEELCRQRREAKTDTQNESISLNEGILDFITNKKSKIFTDEDFEKMGINRTKLNRNKVNRNEINRNEVNRNEINRNEVNKNKAQNESISLNEGAGKVLGIAIALPVTIASFKVIYDMISSKVEGKKLISLKDSKINKHFAVTEKIINKIKFAKYNPDVIPFMDNLTKINNKYTTEINKIDKELYSIKTIDEYIKKKDHFVKKYKDLSKSLDSEIDTVINKYKDSKKEYVENLDIVPYLLKYVKSIDCSYNEPNFRFVDDEMINELPFTKDAYEEELERMPDGAYDPYYVFSMFKYNYVGQNPKFEEPFSMIKVQFSGKTINESVSLNEASLSKAEKDALEDYEFGLPEKRTYPLNDELHINEAIKFFGYCKASDKKTLASNIVRRIIELDLVGVVTITEKHPNKKFFPEWMINTCKPTLERKGNKYTIYVDGEKVDYGTLENHSSDEEGRIVVVNESGMLF